VVASDEDTEKVVDEFFLSNIKHEEQVVVDEKI
jgi:hypothetical protein